MNRSIILFLVFLIVAPLCQVRAQDVSGSRDHPLFSRVQGSTIIKYEQKSFDELVLPLGEFKFFDGVFEEQKRVEGAITRIGYRLPSGRSTLEVIRSYEQAITGHDGEILFECSGESECGNGFDNGLNDLPGEEALFSAETVDEDNQRYLAAKLDSPQGEVYVMVYTYYQYSTERPFIRLRIVETGGKQEQLVTLNADALMQELNQTGHVAVRGIYFDSDKATLRPESEPALREMAKLLNNNPELEVYLVGHTDNTGEFDYNMKLSQWRSKAVGDYLIGNLNVDRGQLATHGVGPLAPVASNDTEAGRQKNRRVEMVKRR